MVDTCAAEFEAKTPYLYSSYAGQDESESATQPKVMILGGGPNRIGQGIEFDYCCVHAAMALRAMGIETIMVNSNPETVSTDFDISDKLYFEPLTPEHVLNIARIEKPLGAIVQFGGQTPLKIAQGARARRPQDPGHLDRQHRPGRRPREVRRARARSHASRARAARSHDRPHRAKKPSSAPTSSAIRSWSALLTSWAARACASFTAKRCSSQWIEEAIQVSDDHPVLIDRFLDHATEVDVDAISDGRETFIGGLMEHIEEAGIHSGDSSCSLPADDVSRRTSRDRIRTYTRELAKRLKVVGLMNAQFAIQGDRIYLLEVNPRASRTVPFVSKAVGKPLAKLAVQVMLGKSLHDLGIREDLDLDLTTFNVKAPVFPFHKFPGVDVLLGPEMKSTGEVMGRGHTFAGRLRQGARRRGHGASASRATLSSRFATRTRPRSSRSRAGSRTWASSSGRPRARRSF